jgi:hypothetical protein
MNRKNKKNQQKKQHQQKTKEESSPFQYKMCVCVFKFIIIMKFIKNFINE